MALFLAVMFVLLLVLWTALTKWGRSQEELRQKSQSISQGSRVPEHQAVAEERHKSKRDLLTALAIILGLFLLVFLK